MGAVHEATAAAGRPRTLLVRSPTGGTTPTATDPMSGGLVEPVAGVVVPAAAVTRSVKHVERVGGRRRGVLVGPMTVGTGRGTAVVDVIATARTFPMLWLVLLDVLSDDAPVVHGAAAASGEAGLDVDAALLGREAGVVVVVVAGAGRTVRLLTAGGGRLARGQVHEVVQGGLVLARGRLHRVRRRVLGGRWREREQMLADGRGLTAGLHLLILFAFLGVLGTAEGTAPAAARGERFRRLVEPGQRAGKVRPAHLGRHMRGHPGGCLNGREEKARV